MIVNDELWADGERWDWRPGTTQGLVQRGGRYVNEFRTHPDPAAPSSGPLTFMVVGDFDLSVGGLAALAPDLDVLIRSETDPLLAIEHHRGFTHSLAVIPVGGAVAALPWFAIGGIDATNVGDVVAAGAERIAVVRAICDAEDPERAAAELRAALPA